MNWNGRILADVGRDCAAMCGFARPGLSCYRPPTLKLALVGKGCVRRTGGRQAQVLDGFDSGDGPHMPAVALLGLGAIEKDTGNLRVGQEERRKIVRNERFVVD